MGVLLRALLLVALLASVTCVDWIQLHAPEHHVHAVKCAKVGCMRICIANALHSEGAKSFTACQGLGECASKKLGTDLTSDSCRRILDKFSLAGCKV